MKPFLSLALALSLSVTATAQDSGGSGSTEVVISSGIENGGYWKIAETLREAAAEAGIVVRNERSSGSVNNLRALAAPGNPVSLAFTQADAAAQYLRDHPEAEEKFHIIQRIGLECVFIVTHPKAKIKDDEDLQKARQLHIGMRSPNSGIRVTWEYMATLVQELADVTMTYGDTVDMLDYLGMPRTDIGAVMFVQGPNEISPEMLRVHSNPDDFRFVKLKDERFLRMSFKGEPVYTLTEVTPGLVEKAKPLETICVQGLLLANTQKLSLDDLDRLERFASEHWDKVHLKQKQAQ